NAERRPTVPPRRTSRYASERPTANRKTASASRQRSPQLNAATSIPLPILVVPAARDEPAPDDGVAFIENSGLAMRDAVEGPVELTQSLPLLVHDVADARLESIAREERAIVVTREEARLLAFRALCDRKSGVRRFRARRLLVLVAEREPHALEMLGIEPCKHVRLVLGVVGAAVQEHATAMLCDPRVVAGREPIAARSSREGKKLPETEAAVAAD